MPFSPEQMPQKSLTPVEETARLKEKIEKAEKTYGRIRPHLAISWPLTQLRKEAFQMVQTGEVNKEVRSHLEHHESPIERILWEKIADTIKEREPIAKTDTQREKMLRLLASKNPSFASLETEVLMSRLKTLEDIVERLQKRFGNKFIGVAVYGSTAGGHMMEESDLDYTLIAYDSEIHEKFKELLQKSKIRPCPLWREYLGVNPDITIGKSGSPIFLGSSRPGDILTPKRIITLAPLFSGLFFGDKNTLLKLQLTILERIDNNLWDKIRSSIIDNVVSVERKAQYRFGLTDSEVRKMQAEIAVVRTPPPYEEALEFIRDQVGKTKENMV